jgi:hypothetical protein
MAGQILKDPYNFDFLTVTAAAKEREIERELLTHLRDLLLKHWDITKRLCFTQPRGLQIRLSRGKNDLRLNCGAYVEVSI